MTRYLKNMEKEIIIDNNPNEIIRVSQFIEEIGTLLQLPPEITMSVNLAIEEAVTNIIRHAYPANIFGEIVLRSKIEPGMLNFLIIDDGIPFNPTDKEMPDSLLPLGEKLAKGLGLYLICRTMDEVSYQIVGKQNQLTLKKRINTDFKPQATIKTNLCKIEGVTILAITGRLDTANTNEFNMVLQPLLTDKNPNIIINCEGMSYISSSGLRSLIILQKSVSQHHGTMTFEAIRPEIKKIFDMTGCSSLFTIR